MKYLRTLLIGTSLIFAPAVALASPPMPQQTHLRAPAAAAASTATEPQLARTSNSDRAAPQASLTEDAARYAARDNAALNAKQYRGGDTLVIGASAATAILAVVLLIVLL